MKFTDDDINRLKSSFPHLIFDKYKKKITGDLTFTAIYDQKFCAYHIINPTKQGPFIRGVFAIEVDISKPNPYREVYETGGKVLLLAKRKGEHLINLHANQIGITKRVNVCIAGHLQEDLEISIYDFFCKYVVQYFCDLIFFEQKNYWPRGSFAHGCAGILEDYNEQLHYLEHKQLTETCLEELKVQKNEYQELILPILTRKHLRRHSRWIDKKNLNQRLKDILSTRAINGLQVLRLNIKKFKLNCNLL